MKNMTKDDIAELKRQRLDEFLTELANAAADTAGYTDETDPEGDMLHEIRDALFAAHARSLFVVDVRKLGEDVDLRCGKCDAVVESAD